MVDPMRIAHDQIAITFVCTCGAILTKTAWTKERPSLLPYPTLTTNYTNVTCEQCSTLYAFKIDLDEREKEKTFPAFKTLTPEEEIMFRQYARDIDPPDMAHWSIYHPVCRDEWTKRGIQPPADTQRS